MNISKAEGLIKPALDRFCEYAGKQIKVMVYLLSKEETGSERKEIYEEVGAQYEPFVETSQSETVIGEKGLAVIIYPFNVFSARDLIHALYHECGHVLFRQVNEELSIQYKNGKLSEAAHMGFTLFEEFIAEALANLAETEKAYYDEEQRRSHLVHLLYSAIPGINREPTRQAMEESAMFMRSCLYVLPAPLGRYAAMKLTDPTIVKLLQEDRDCDTGLLACGDKTAKETDSITYILSEYLDSCAMAAYVDEETLCAIGRHVINIWNLRAAIKRR